MYFRWPTGCKIFPFSFSNWIHLISAVLIGWIWERRRLARMFVITIQKYYSYSNIPTRIFNTNHGQVGFSSQNIALFWRSFLISEDLWYIIFSVCEIFVLILYYTLSNDNSQFFILKRQRRKKLITLTIWNKEF